MKNVRTLQLILIALLLLVVVPKSFAQGRFGKDSAECVNNLNFYRDFYRQDDMINAKGFWMLAFKVCPPTVTPNLYIHGKKILRTNIDRETDIAKKMALVDTLILLNETRSQYYPKYRQTAKEDKVNDMMIFWGDKPEKAKQIFEEVKSYTEEFGANSDVSVLVNGMIKAGEAFERNELSAEDVMSAYSLFNGALEERKKAGIDPDIEEKEKVLQNAFVQSGIASCENLIKVFTPRFEQNKQDTTTLETIASLLIANECTDTELFSEIASQLYKLKPSSDNAYYLYRLYSQKGDSDKAFEYLKEAANIATGTNKGIYLYEMATIHYKNHAYGAAAAAARQVGEYNSSYAGKADMLLGNIWAGASCGGNEIQRRAKFWVATDYMVKAKSKDSSLASEADKNIARYRSYFPSTADAFMFDLTDGKSYTISCGGMTATTTVRTNK